MILRQPFSFMPPPYLGPPTPLVSDDGNSLSLNLSSFHELRPFLIQSPVFVANWRDRISGDLSCAVIQFVRRPIPPGVAKAFCGVAFATIVRLCFPLLWSPSIGLHLRPRTDLLRTPRLISFFIRAHARSLPLFFSITGHQPPEEEDQPPTVVCLLANDLLILGVSPSAYHLLE